MQEASEKLLFKTFASVFKLNHIFKTFQFAVYNHKNTESQESSNKMVQISIKDLYAYTLISMRSAEYIKYSIFNIFRVDES